MASVKDRAVKMHPTFQNIFDKHFPVKQTPKTDTREEEKQEAKQKPNKERDND